MANMILLKPKVVIIGAGVAGLAAANKLYTIAGSKLEICVVEGGTRIGGRVNTSELGGDGIEMGATWIHGINGSPIYKIAQEINSLHSQQPWERMNGFPENPVTLAEGGFEIDSDILSSITRLFRNLRNISQGKPVQGKEEFQKICSRACGSDDELEKLSVGSFLRKGLDAYWDSVKKDEGDGIMFDGKWTWKSLEEAIFAMYENIHRGYTAAGDLFNLDFAAESEYQTFPGKEITIAKGYTSVIQSLASVLPSDSIHLNRKVVKIEWKEDEHPCLEAENVTRNRPVKLHFCDGSIMQADHVIVTVSLGVLKAGIQRNAGMFHPPLPASKSEAISRLGFGIVDKLFLQLSSTLDQGDKFAKFPNLHMVFHPSDSEMREEKIPWWIRRSASLAPIYHNSSVLLCWFVGDEALELEKLNDEEIINAFSTTVSSFIHEKMGMKSHELCNGEEITFSKIMKSQWGTDPLFLGSYTYVAVGSNVNDFDLIAEPLPKLSPSDSSPSPPLQILFAGEATHRSHYSTTHGAYMSGLREANRLLELYHCGGV